MQTLVLELLYFQREFLATSSIEGSSLPLSLALRFEFKHETTVSPEVKILH